MQLKAKADQYTIIRNFLTLFLSQVFSKQIFQKHDPNVMVYTQIMFESFYLHY